ncbi:HAD family phosphatase [Candidatus Woesearchaeota archaeon]|nr:HAD family phosphatase [Candidatus Woesearchaeota archaeon]
MIKLVIFDLCGVVFYCEEPPFLKYFSEKYKFPVEKIEEIYSMHIKKAEAGEISTQEAMEGFLEYFDVKADYKDMLRKMMSFKGLNENTVRLLKELKGKVKLAYLTNSSVEVMDCSEERLPVKQYFDFGIISEEIKVRKPDPKGFELLLNHFSAAPEETIFIDDGEKNLTNAKKMGIHTVHFQGTEQLKAQLKKLQMEV